MTLIIDGVNLSPHVQESGVVRGTTFRNTKTRTTIEGKKYQGKVKKLLLEIPFDPMSETDLKTVVSAVDKDYVSVQYKDPILGSLNRTFIPSVGEVSLIMENKNGVSYWSGFVVNLEEQ